MAVFLSEAEQTENKAKQSRTASCDLVGPLQPETHRYMTATYTVSVCIVPLYRVASTLRICVSKAFSSPHRGVLWLTWRPQCDPDGEGWQVIACGWLSDKLLEGESHRANRGSCLSELQRRRKHMEGGGGGAGKVTFSEHRFRVSVTEVYIVLID